MAKNEIIIDLGNSLKRINELGLRLRDTETLTATISETMLSDISQHFEDEKGPDDPWKDLAESTKKARQKKGHWPGKKLQVQSRGSGLLGSLQPQHDQSSASVVTNKVYAAIHHFGGQAGPGKKVTIPARPYLYLSDEAKEEIRDLIREHILE